MSAMAACSRWLLLLSFTWQALAAPRRLLEDEMVLSAQHSFSTQWRKKFNKGEVDYCGEAYASDATLHVTFGPLADLVKKKIFLPEPAILHGRELMIKPFWNATQKVLGFRDMRAYEDEGEYASTAMVVNDDTVVVSGPFSFKSDLGEVKGQMLSEMWVRKEKEWKLQSAMMVFQALAAQSANGAAGAKETTPAPSTSLRAGSTSLSSEDVNNTIVAADVGAKTAVSEGHGTFLAGVTILVVASVAAVMVRRAKNRRAAAISGFESMLG